MSKINVNTVDTQCGSTLTLGSSGKTVTLASGASQSGFGRTGTVDWCTTAKTSPFTAVNGKGYFVNTTSGAVTVTLPASPSAGDIVAIKDYANTFDTNNLTIGRNSSKINGQCNDAVLNTESQSVTLIYVDGTKGWQDIHDSTSDVTGTDFITATGGTVTTVCTNYKVHTFTSDGTFCVSSGTGPLATVSYMVVAGGGGSAADRGGGGGAGGFREGKQNTPLSPDTYSVSPLAATTGIPLSPGPYPVTVGGGGAADNTSPYEDGASGSNSVFSTITSAGGGGGGHTPAPGAVGVAGGSGGGAGTVSPHAVRCGGAGNTPPVSPPQGNPGGKNGLNPGGPPWGYTQGGGGGATVAGGDGNVCQNAGPTADGGDGGTGATTSISGSPTSYAGGGGGGTDGPTSYVGPGGTGGGGNGGSPGVATQSGTANTGGGGGGSSGGGTGVCGGDGGSGIVIIRYKFQ
jgi:hypothetical protein